FFPTAEESIDYYNQKRCVDGKGLVLPSQIVSNGLLVIFLDDTFYIGAFLEDSGFTIALIGSGPQLPSLIIMPEDFWFSAPKKGVMVFALPGESGLTELAGDFKVHFNDRQGDFYCWLNTTMIENRKILSTGDLDGFDKDFLWELGILKWLRKKERAWNENGCGNGKLPSPGFQVEIVLVDYSGTAPTKSQTETPTNKQDESSGTSESADGATSKSKTTNSDQVASLVKSTEKVSIGSTDTQHTHAINEPRKDTVQQAADAADARVSISSSESQFKAMAADASVFSFGDEEDFDSE
ncbi:hypothetical protein Goari_017212, partial [Gossypium aridum]|nr:hypothetical protein [Gossypium aridum]